MNSQSNKYTYIYMEFKDIHIYKQGLSQHKILSVVLCGAGHRQLLQMIHKYLQAHIISQNGSGLLHTQKTPAILNMNNQRAWPSMLGSLIIRAWPSMLGSLIIRAWPSMLGSLIIREHGPLCWVH